MFIIGRCELCCVLAVMLQLRLGVSCKVGSIPIYFSRFRCTGGGLAIPPGVSRVLLTVFQRMEDPLLSRCDRILPIRVFLTIHQLPPQGGWFRYPERCVLAHQLRAPLGGRPKHLKKLLYNKFNAFTKHIKGSS